MINAFLFWFLVISCMAFAGLIIWMAWPRKSEKSKRVYYEYPMEWQQEEYERVAKPLQSKPLQRGQHDRE